MGKTSEGQIPLLDVSQFESGGKAGFSDWEIDCGDTESSISESSISESSISESSISESSISESSISARDIEPLGFNLYTKVKNGKPYTYWRYSYRTGKQMNHIHIGKIDRVLEIRGQPRHEVLAALGRD